MQALKFFITGLPRSRTAWFANFFTTGGSFCYHEALNHYPNKGALTGAMTGAKFYYGNSDSALPFTKFQEWFNAPTVIIERNADEVIESLYKLYGEHAAIPKLVLAGQVKLKHLRGLRVAFQDIDSRLHEIWDYCVDSIYDVERAEALMKLNIQTTDLTGNSASLKEIISCRG